MLKKRCIKCDLLKVLTEYHKDKNLKDGHKSVCRTCVKLRKQHYKRVKLEKTKAEKPVDEKPVANTDNGLPRITDFWDEIKDKKDNMFTACLSATSSSGKSTLLNYMIWQLKKQKAYDIYVMISQNEDIDMYNNDLYDIKINRKQMDRFVKQIRLFQKKTGRQLKIFLALDDVTNGNFKNNNVLTDLFMNGRNQNISTVLSSQSDKLVAKNIRKNVHFAILLRSKNISMNEANVESFMWGFIRPPPEYNTKQKKLDYLYSFMDKHTKDYNALVLHYNAKDDNKNVQLYKAAKII